MSPGRSFFVSSSASDFGRIGTAEIDHDGDAGDRARLDGPLDRREVRAHVVGRLDAHDQALVAQGHLGRRLGLHVLEVLLDQDAAHPAADDVEEAKTRVLARSMIRVLKSSKFRQPAQPASATAVTPERSVKPSG